MEKEIITFGAALDATDFSLNVQTKHAYLRRLENNALKEPNFLDPYEGMLEQSQVLLDSKFRKIGRLDVETWLTPKPLLEDRPKITQLAFQDAIYDGTILKYTKKLEEFIKKNVYPGIPLMIGIDHSLTGGALRALSKQYGVENILLIVFDAHFDGIPASISYKIGEYMKEHPNEVNPLVASEELLNEVDIDIKDTYTCASFLYYLIDEKFILPNNLIIFGCQDYPNEKLRAINDSRIKEYVDFFDLMEKKGVNFIPMIECSQMIEKLELLLAKTTKSRVYISFDVDVGGLKEIIAARFRNAVGMNKEDIIKAASTIKNYMETKNSELIGLDIMEIETHLLGKEFPKSGRKDRTIEVIDDFLDIFF